MHNFGSECGKKLNEREFEKRFIERKALNSKLPRCPSVILFPSRFIINLTKHFWVNSRDGLLNVQPRDGVLNLDFLIRAFHPINQCPSFSLMPSELLAQSYQLHRKCLSI